MIGLIRVLTSNPAMMGSIVAQVVARRIDTSILERRWTTKDVLKLAWWGSVHPAGTLLTVAAGFDGILHGRLMALFWFLAATITSVLGLTAMRSAQGMNKRRVKSGKLYVRALYLAREMGVKLTRIYVIPPGKGDLTNAFASWRSIALTDNFGEYLHGAQLDCVIAHELAHIKSGHARKQLFMLLALLCFLAPVSLVLGYLLPRERPMVITFLLLATLLSYYAMSRRCEYQADRDSALFTGNPEAEIRSLAALYSKTGTPTALSNLAELFMTHPSFTRRISAIARLGEIPAHRVSEILLDAGLTNGALLQTH
jgi:Zn-dependent protease with chaperone function